MSFDSQAADKFAKVISEAHQTGDFQTMVDNIPYAQFIGLKFQRLGQDILVQLPADTDNIGNPILPAIQGGVIGRFMELAASLQLVMTMDSVALPKIVDFSLDYLRAGRLKDTYAECQVWRQGSRVANVAKIGRAHV